MGNKFSNRNVGDNSLRKRAEGLQEKVERLEEMVGQLMLGIQEQSKRTGNTLGYLAETSQAVVEIIGKDQVAALIEEKRLVRAQEVADKDKEGLEKAIAEGWVTSTDKVAADSFLVGKETLANGKLLGVGRQSVAFSSLAPEYQMELLGKTVGAVAKTPVGGTFEIQEIYTLDQAKGQEVLARQEREAAEAAQKAAEAAASVDEAKDAE